MIACSCEIGMPASALRLPNVLRKSRSVSDCQPRLTVALRTISAGVLSLYGQYLFAESLGVCSSSASRTAGPQRDHPRVPVRCHVCRETQRAIDAVRRPHVQKLPGAKAGANRDRDESPPAWPDRVPQDLLLAVRQHPGPRRLRQLHTSPGVLSRAALRRPRVRNSWLVLLHRNHTFPNASSVPSITFNTPARSLMRRSCRAVGRAKKRPRA